jgi:hypothetical protein
MAHQIIPAIGQVLSHRTLPDLLWEIAQSAWGRRDAVFVQSNPKEHVDGPTITWKVHRRLPGRLGIEHLKPRQRTVSDDLLQMERTEKWAQWHTVWYDFHIHAKTAIEADKLAEDWESLVFSCQGILKQAGVDEFLFDEELPDDQLNTKQDIHVRRLRFLCIIERTYTKVVPLIRQVLLRVLNERILKDNEPIVRGSGSSDEFPDPWVDVVYHVTDEPAILITEIGNYVHNVDFNLSKDDDGTCSIEWIDGRSKPTEGSTYYISYSAFTSHPLQNLAP